GEKGPGQSLGEGLHQGDMAGGGDLAGLLDDGVVVESVGEPLEAAYGDVELDIGGEGLGAAELMVVDADGGVELQAANEDPREDDAVLGLGLGVGRCLLRTCGLRHEAS